MIDFSAVPETLGVYFLWLDGACIYVGTSRSIRSRLISGHHLHSIIRKCDKVTWIECCECGRRDLEKFFIQHLKPEYNRLWVVPARKKNGMAVSLRCGVEAKRLVEEYSQRAHIPMRRVMDDMVSDWMKTVGKARLEAYDRINGVSQIEKNT